MDNKELEHQLNLQESKIRLLECYLEESKEREADLFIRLDALEINFKKTLEFLIKQKEND